MLKQIICTIAIGALISCEATADKVTTSRNRIKVNGKQYIIRGICYNPVPKGSSERSFETLTEDLALMKEAGINTIRTYSPIDDKAVLDEIDAAGIKVIMGFGYNQKGYYDVLTGSFIDYVKKYMDHPAILLWELGNEYNYHPYWFFEEGGEGGEGDINIWYEALNDAAKLIHKTDKNHPVSSAHGDLPTDEVLSACKEVDVWGINAYRWDEPDKSDANIFQDFSAASSKPMYLSETGADSYMTIESHEYEQGENQQAQADAVTNILVAVFNNQKTCSGVTLFSFTDGWWKAGNPHRQDTGGDAPGDGFPYDNVPNEEYWGIVDIDRNKKLTFDVVKEIYNKNAK